MKYGININENSNDSNDSKDNDMLIVVLLLNKFLLHFYHKIYIKIEV